MRTILINVSGRLVHDFFVKYVGWIVSYVVSVEKLDVFLLISFRLVMFNLISDVFLYRLGHGLANGKRRVAFLPVEFSSHAICFVDPMRRVSFQLTNGVGDSEGWVRPEKQVYVVLNPTGLQQYSFVLFDLNADNGEQIIAPLVVQ